MDPELLQTIANDPEGARRMLHNALAERAAGDPRMAALMQMMQQRQQQLPAGEPTRPRNGTVERVRRRVQEMRGELRVLRDRAEELAAALGACPMCWGDDGDCPRCGGDGSPGWLAPDPELFEDLIQPAIARRTRAADENPDPRREP